MRAGLLLAIAVWVTGCQGPEPRPVRLDLTHRQSCGTSAFTYETSCVAALVVSVLDAQEQTLVSSCTRLAEPRELINDFLASATQLPLLDEVPPYPGVRIEFRGYHAINKSDACANLTESELMLWGSSALVNLAEPELDEIEVQFECRPYCDCRKMDDEPATCPPALEPGVCVRPSPFLCRKGCTTGADCYEEMLACVSSACEPAMGGMCYDCNGLTDCTTGRCVQNNDHPSVTERFCALRCPPLETEGTRTCPDSMSCRRLGSSASDSFQEIP